MRRRPTYTPTPLPYRYPDARVACYEPKYKNKKGHDALVNPFVLDASVETESVGCATRLRDTCDGVAFPA